MHFDRLKRRELITLVGGAAASWPVLAGAQQRDRMRRIGVLTPLAADGGEGNARLTAFAQALQQLGWSVGQNVRIDYRWGPGNAETMRKPAAELVALAPDVILALNSAAVAPLLEASRTVPIVFAAIADPVAAGFVESVERPGGNVTGFMNFEYSLSGKWLELLKQIGRRDGWGNHTLMLRELPYVKASTWRSASSFSIICKSRSEDERQRGDALAVRRRWSATT